MNRIRLQLSSIASDDFNSTLASAFNIIPLNDLMFIPADKGEGFVYRNKIDQELFLIFWEFVLKKKIAIYKRGVIPEEKHKSISIIYILLEDDIDTGNLKNKKTFNPKNGRTVLLVSDNSELKFEIPAGKKIKVVSVSIGLDWLKKEFSESANLYEVYFNTLYKKINSSPLVYSTTPGDLKLLAEIGSQVNTGSGSLLFLKARTLLLVSDFFSRIINGPVPGEDRQKILHYEQMKMFENILTSHLEKKLPNLPALAKEMFLSTSTLKRNFKIIFGKNIYQYYLELKMNYAKKLFMEKSLPVNEVAHLLHYENVSGFIEIFKKHHGVSPGSLIKGNN